MSAYATVAVLGYLIGSFPAGYVAGRIAGVDIRTHGSGNIGATNVLRVLGKRFGYAVFLVDFGKGVAAVLVARHITSVNGTDERAVELAATLAGIVAVIGHSFPVWLKFRGGKGVATSIGVLFALLPLAGAVVCLVWLATFEIARYVSLASVVAAVALPIAVAAMFFLHRLQTPVLLYCSLCLAALVIVRHRSNLARLAKGTEPRFSRK
ncbi:MAG TPA: glycerol-3-phosphate 1-O-acyltransferase PlsY [Chthoniobacterales bacterium]|nr:glycerol-3-phosphate 1-O-acyltransferase PlsY [Chthoniobacterales bacterium]